MKLTTKLVMGAFSLFALTQGTIKAQTPVTKESPDFRVFPNPSKEGETTFVSLKGVESENMLVVVYDMLGREIYSKVEVKENGGYLFTINTGGSSLSKGVYLIIGSSVDKHFSQKLIVQ